MNIEHEINQALALRDHWMQVPHKCGLTDCPGDLNRRKLELYEQLVAAIKEMEPKIQNSLFYGEDEATKRVLECLWKAEHLK